MRKPVRRRLAQARRCTPRTPGSPYQQKHPMPDTILITGASAGFGAAMARRFAAGGARVIAASRRLDRLQALAGELAKP